ncbi:alanine--tRNA ligase [Desulfotalea psychrophila]|uniref:Alanine--tRNA ligase n=1 Tax=Desulfotalea psychrophila (strain LSv54 / DSM 12343) TaxID=177439 RepID=SYA_DESPS|nr:alanine--tRNA ligase [Desulfotalea psychrophila]Q6AQ16.1 RecName: Full=Alanine--tRNA ligase; AltName: Full=Alanyl-tRNA synthetase; Short=AlaRS [Desulfotalea psychrophila LSv54]CAG35557.1 probable alanyl-tRNA synthetase [Desulfotalea psychrophila LSv54]
MKGNEIRSRFLEYFKGNGHTVAESSSLVPKDDPTLLFTNAGMVQFKRVFMGDDKRGYVRAVTSQKCVRAGGKHNDLENVGYTARHHTFFEMLGNFSFGDYFKEEAIRLAWNFLTVELGLPAEKMWVSVFEDDDEAFALWEKVEDLPKGRIVRLGEKDNFWAMGDTGPCGPCSEIHIDQGVGSSPCDNPNCAVGCDCDRFLELWNLVFMQFNRAEDGSLTALPRPSIDTGMGLERVAAVLQGKFNNYDSDLFAPIIAVLEDISGVKYGAAADTDTAIRVIADHARATSFLVADGVLPSNEGRGYVLRRIMRRAVRYGKKLGLEKPFMDRVTKAVCAEMQNAYPQLVATAALLEKVVNNEEERFRETLEHGLVQLDEKISQLLTSGGDAVIDGPFIFKLYDTFGFPFDIVRDIALERGVGFDEAGFATAMAEQRAKSRASRKGEGVKLHDEGVKALADAGKKAEFLGYEGLEADSVVEGLLSEQGSGVEKLVAGEKGRVFVAATPFYAEAGGQMGDRGSVRWQGGQASVYATQAEGTGLILHDLLVEEGELSLGLEVTLQVDDEERKATASNHSATHLLQAALISVLGDHVKQSGSLVGPERLRFDFTNFSQLTAAEIAQVETLVNEQIRNNAVIATDVLSKQEAIAGGATALFGEKYDDDVRVVSMGDYSRELCGGTHVGATGEIGLFVILSESGIAAGVRRIEALTGRAALAYVQGRLSTGNELADLLSCKSGDLVPKVESLLTAVKEGEKRVAQLAGQLASSGLDDLLNNALTVAGIKVVVAEVPLENAKALRELGDKVRDNLESGIAVIGGAVGGKVALLAIVTKDLVDRIQAGRIVSEVSGIVGGKGGGRPDMAQAGGTMPDKLSEAIASVPAIIEAML